MERRGWIREVLVSYDLLWEGREKEETFPSDSVSWRDGETTSDMRKNKVRKNESRSGMKYWLRVLVRHPGRCLPWNAGKEERAVEKWRCNRCQRSMKTSWKEKKYPWAGPARTILPSYLPGLPSLPFS